MSSTRHLSHLLSVVLTLVLLAGCSKSEEPKKPTTPPAAVTAPVATPPATVIPTAAREPSPAQAKPTRPPQSGKITESKQAGPHTFVQVEADGEQYWLATNPFKPKVGEVVHWDQFTVKRNYHSKALNQTFPMVMFVGAILPGPAPLPTTTSKGKVHSVLQSGGYTYVQIGNATGAWLAAPTVKVKEGDAVVWTPGTSMKNFTSKTLNRTFPEIQFLSGLKVESVAAVKPTPEESKAQRRTTPAETGKAVSKPAPPANRPPPQKPKGTTTSER
ncbi:MAG: hypothetical protein HQM00_16575 [Magnetococcales bacterium]|nr:hypothetical protein [Magnetococcales bacterium]